MLNICSWPRGQTFSCYIHYESQQRIFPRESIKCFIRVYVGVIIDLLMYMTWNELLSTMNVKISWLYSYHAEKEEAGQEIIEYPYMHRAYYWKNISVLTSNICTVSIRSKKKIKAFYCTAQRMKCIKMAFSFISEQEYRQQCIWNMT